MICRRLPLIIIMTLLSFASENASASDARAPQLPVKLIFIHHSTGGHWLADANSDQPYGGLGMALMKNNYFVSATNYGWGPDSVGDRTDIPNWPEWFTGPNSSNILSALYIETEQNFEGFGDWSRMATDPGGENEIVMFKSCFPNSDLFGHPDDPPSAAPNDEYTVSNAKTVYNNLLTYFRTRPDKLFIVITAPPQNENEYREDVQTPAERAANTRAFCTWLVNEWLDGYPYDNVAVFDYHNVLTGSDNHHRWYNGSVQHIRNADNNFSAYPVDAYNSHPNTAGQQKATSEFVPLLNFFYNRWKQSSTCTNVSANLDLYLCAQYQTVHYGFTLNYSPVPDDPTGLYWKMNVSTFEVLQSNSLPCISVGDDLDLSLCVQYQGVQYGFRLNYLPIPGDPAGLYWKMDISTFRLMTPISGGDPK
jgi:hypothetical protein